MQSQLISVRCKKLKEFFKEAMAVLIIDNNKEKSWNREWWVRNIWWGQMAQQKIILMFSNQHNDNNNHDGWVLWNRLVNCSYQDISLDNLSVHLKNHILMNSNKLCARQRPVQHQNKNKEAKQKAFKTFLLHTVIKTEESLWNHKTQIDDLILYFKVLNLQIFITEYNKYLF